MIEKAQKEDLKEILELQYLAYQSEAKLFGDIDIPLLRQTIEEVAKNLQRKTHRIFFDGYSDAGNGWN